jgi:predicted AlkP superfamily pyrophosphatase or phosphodiesterase
MARRVAGLTVGLFALVCLSWAIAQAPPSQAQPAAAKRVVIISVDGLRPDLALRAETPTIRGLLKSGAFTFWARTTAVSITLPSHTSMLTGVVPDRHGITWNSDLPLTHPIYPARPTLFEVAHKAGLTAAMCAGKAKFNTLDKPGTLDWCFVQEKASDQEVADHAVAMIHEHKPQVLFVHLPETDATGHKCGWGSPEQIKVIENADAQIHRVLEALDQENLRSQTLVIVTADHGGAGLTHGADDPRSRHIPWIVTGPGVRENFDLTRLPRLTVNTEDSFATACWFLNLPIAGDIDGKPITEIIQPLQPAIK